MDTVFFLSRFLCWNLLFSPCISLLPVYGEFIDDKNDAQASSGKFNFSCQFMRTFIAGFLCFIYWVMELILAICYASVSVCDGAIIISACTRWKSCLQGLYKERQLKRQKRHASCILLGLALVLADAMWAGLRFYLAVSVVCGLIFDDY